MESCRSYSIGLHTGFPEVKQFIKQLFKQFIKRLKQFRFIKLRFIICNCSVGFRLCMAYTGLCKPFI